MPLHALSSIFGDVSTKNYRTIRLGPGMMRLSGEDIETTSGVPDDPMKVIVLALKLLKDVRIC
jgi:hypothetical protein